MVQQFSLPRPEIDLIQKLSGISCTRRVSSMYFCRTVQVREIQRDSFTGVGPSLERGTWRLTECVSSTFVNVTSEYWVRTKMRLSRRMVCSRWNMKMFFQIDFPSLRLLCRGSFSEAPDGIWTVHRFMRSPLVAYFSFASWFRPGRRWRNGPSPCPFCSRNILPFRFSSTDIELWALGLVWSFSHMWLMLQSTALWFSSDRTPWPKLAAVRESWLWSTWCIPSRLLTWGLLLIILVFHGVPAAKSIEQRDGCPLPSCRSTSLLKFSGRGLPSRWITRATYSPSLYVRLRWSWAQS